MRLPKSEADFRDNYETMKFKHCIQCEKGLTDGNTHTVLGWQETQISGYCEDCFDHAFDYDSEYPND